MSKTQPREHGRFVSPNNEPLAKQVIGIRLPESVHEVVYPLPERTAWLRRIITQAAQEELMQPYEKTAKEEHDANLTAVIHREENLYVAECPELDIASQGNNPTEARQNLQEAVELFLEVASSTEVKTFGRQDPNLLGGIGYIPDEAIVSKRQ